MNRKSATDKTHRTRRGGELRVVYVMTGFFLENDVADKLDDFRPARAAAHPVAQIMLGSRKQTRADLPVGGQTNARTRAAEHFRDRRDNADLARGIIGESIFPGRFAAARGFF